MTLTGHAPQTFRASASAIIAGLFAIAAGFLVLEIAGGIAVLLLLRSVVPPSVLNHLLTAVLIVVPIVGLLLIVRRATARFVVADGELREEWLGRAWRRWSLATTTVRWHATRRLTNGVYQGTTRTLILQPFGGAERRVVPWRFDARRFTELVAALNGPALPAPQEDAAVDREYAIAKGRLTSAFIARIVLAVVAVAVVVVVFFFIAQGTASEDPESALAELVLPPLLGALFIGWIVGTGIVRQRGVPRRVRVNRNAITIDGREFAYVALSRIVTTAPYSGVGEREIVLYDAAGAAIRSSFTGAPPSTAAMTTLPPVQEPHALFVHELLQASAWRGHGFVQFLLG